MPLETTTTRLQQISSRTVNTKNGPSIIYDFTLDGFNKPFSTFNKELVDMTMQGKMVKADYSVQEKPWTAQDGSGRSGTYKNFYLENIISVQGDVGTLDDVIAPQVSPPIDTRVPTNTSLAKESVNGHSDKDESIRRSVAVQEATKIYVAMLEAGMTPTNAEFQNSARLVYETHGSLGS